MRPTATKKVIGLPVQLILLNRTGRGERLDRGAPCRATITFFTRTAKLLSSRAWPFFDRLRSLRRARSAMLLIAIGLSLLGALAFRERSFPGGASLAISAVTLLVLPILQATQNRDGAALQAKIGELIKAYDGARNSLIGIQEARSLRTYS